MHQRRRLQRLSRLFLRKAGGRQLTKFLVNEGQELLGGGGVARFDARKDAGNFGHGLEDTATIGWFLSLGDSFRDPWSTRGRMVEFRPGVCLGRAAVRLVSDGQLAVTMAKRVAAPPGYESREMLRFRRLRAIGYKA